MVKKIHIIAFLIVVAILMVTFFVRDWFVFYQCGAVEQCLVDASNYQNIAKFAVTSIVTVIVFFIGKNALCARDRHFLQAAFVMALCADSIEYFLDADTWLYLDEIGDDMPKGFFENFTRNSQVAPYRFSSNFAL